MKTKLFLLILSISFLILMNGCKIKCGDFPSNAEGLLPAKFQNTTCRYLMNSRDTMVIKGEVMVKHGGQERLKCDKCICSREATMRVFNDTIGMDYTAFIMSGSRKRKAEYDDIYNVSIRFKDTYFCFDYNIRNHTYVDYQRGSSIVVLERYSVLGKTYENVAKLVKGEYVAYYVFNYGLIKIEREQNDYVLELID